MMNDHYLPREGCKYVPLDPRKVKTKLERYGVAWLAQGTGSKPKQMFSSAGPALKDQDAVFTSLFSVSEATSTGAPSVSKKRTSTEDMKDIVPEDRQSALDYLSANGSEQMELFLLTAILEDPTALDSFLAMKSKSYEERRKYLIFLCKNRLVRSPRLDSIDPTSLPPDFR